MFLLQNSNSDTCYVNIDDDWSGTILSAFKLEPDQIKKCKFEYCGISIIYYDQTHNWKTTRMFIPDCDVLIVIQDTEVAIRKYTKTVTSRL